MKNKTNKSKRVKAWAIIHKHKNMVMEVAFVDCGDFKPTKSMFTHENGRPAWTGGKYNLVPVEIHILDAK